MAGVLVYTSPARGHLFPLVPTLQEVQRRGHRVALRTLSSEVQRMRNLGFRTEAVLSAVETRELDDWKALSALTALRRALRTFADRAPAEVEDVQEGIRVESPEVLLVDVNSWGAQAAAEASGLPWALFSPYLLPFRGPGIPPWGLGLRPRRDSLGRWRDAFLWQAWRWLCRPGVNHLRGQVGLPPVGSFEDLLARPPRLLYYTAEPFEYPRRPWPDHVRLVGPGLWEPPGPSAELPPTGPIVLVTCSTEFQDDGRLVTDALQALAGEPLHVVATTAALEADRFRPPANATVARFMPHGPLLERAVCVVCHAGMGITQKALAAGVPVCAVPFGRDQLEVARHVEEAGAGVSLPASRLTVERLREAVRRSIACKPGAERVAEAFRASGGPEAAADALEELLAGRKGRRVSEAH